MHSLSVASNGFSIKLPSAAFFFHFIMIHSIACSNVEKNACSIENYTKKNSDRRTQQQQKNNAEKSVVRM